MIELEIGKKYTHKELESLGLQREGQNNKTHFYRNKNMLYVLKDYGSDMLVFHEMRELEEM